MTEQVKTQPTAEELAQQKIEGVKQELRYLKDLREILKGYTRVSAADAEKAAAVWNTTTALVAQCEHFLREAKKEKKNETQEQAK
jgi:hypothetical protein